VTGLGWPDGPATWKQEWLLRKLLLDVHNEQLMADHGYTEGTASAEIKRLLQLQKERDAA
jgi:hypothetical protein